MLRHFSSLALLCWFVLTGLFFLLCFYEWQGQAYPQEVAFCGTESFYSSNPQDSLYDLGKHIFRNNCAACHAGDMKTNLTGPALGGMQERWQAHGGDEALYAWIRNSSKVIEEGKNERARALWQEWGPTVMNSFENLTDEEIIGVINYVEEVYGGSYLVYN